MSDTSTTERTKPLVAIYVLIDPRDGSTRYVGQSKRRSPDELAHAEHLIAKVDERVKRTLKKMGHVEGLTYLNLRLAERHAARGIRYG